MHASVFCFEYYINPVISAIYNNDNNMKKLNKYNSFRKCECAQTNYIYIYLYYRVFRNKFNSGHCSYTSCGIIATNQSGMHFRTLENERRKKKIILITDR